VLILPLQVLLLFSILQAQSSQSVPSRHERWQDVEVKIGDRKSISSVHSIDLGFVAAKSDVAPINAPDFGKTCWSSPSPQAKTTSEIQITVTNVSGDPLTLSLLYNGSKVQANWKGQLKASDNTRTLQPKGAGEIDASFDVGDGTYQDANTIVLMSGGRPTTLFILDYVILRPYLRVEYDSGDVNSGAGGNFNRQNFRPGTRYFNLGYVVATGPAPVGYTVAKACYWLTGDRPQCGTYSMCSWGKGPDDEDVAFSFFLQGHAENGTAAESRGHLLVFYKVKSTAPALGPTLHELLKKLEDMLIRLPPYQY
jgi:hypothetical protein